MDKAIQAIQDRKRQFEQRLAVLKDIFAKAETRAWIACCDLLLEDLHQLKREEVRCSP